MANLVIEIFQATRDLVQPYDVADWLETVKDNTRDIHRGYCIREAAKAIKILDQKTNKPVSELFVQAKKAILDSKKPEYPTVIDIIARYSVRGVAFFKYIEPEESKTTANVIKLKNYAKHHHDKQQELRAQNQSSGAQKK